MQNNEQEGEDQFNSRRKSTQELTNVQRIKMKANFDKRKDDYRQIILILKNRERKYLKK